MSGDETARFVYLAILLALVGSGVVVGARGNLGRNLRYLGIWVAIFALVAVLASFRPELSRIGGRLKGELDPAGGEVAGGALRLPKRNDGHFWVRAEVNGRPILFMIDTGASDIILTRDAARTAGIDPSSLVFASPMQTANGQARSAPVTLDRLNVGPIERHRIRAMVGGEGLDVNLLGMAFLDTLSSYRVEDQALLLVP